MGSCEVEGETIAVGSVPALVVVVVVVGVVILAGVVVEIAPVAAGEKELSSISVRQGAEGVRRVILFSEDPDPSSIFPALLS